MKRISPILFLTLTSSMVLNSHASLAQSQSQDMAPGPIAELLPKFDRPAESRFEVLESEFDRLPTTGSNTDQLLEKNRLPSALEEASDVIEPPEGSELPLFDTPATPSSTDALINSVPPQMPSAATAIPPTPGSFYPGSTPVETSRILPGEAAVYSDIPGTAPNAPASTLSAAPFGSREIVSQGDCNCEGHVSSADQCGNVIPEKQAYMDAGCVDYNHNDSSECTLSEDEFHDTGAVRIDAKSSSRRGKVGIFERHRAKHLAKAEARANQKQNSHRHTEQSQPVTFDEIHVDQDQHLAFGEDQTCEIRPPAEVAYVQAPNDVALDQNHSQNSSVNTIIGVSGLYFSRNYEDGLQFSGSSFAGERGLFSRDADHGDFGGYEAHLTRRKANGNGFEVRFFDLSPSRATASLGGRPFTTLSGGTTRADAAFLSGVGAQDIDFGNGTVRDVSAAEVFNFGDVHQVVRETSIQNAEFNFLRLGRTGQRQRGAGRTASHEYLIGFRYLRFDESFNYNARVFRPGNVASGLSRADYLNEVTNRLYGAQIGGRTEIGFLKRFSVIVGTKAGIFNNNFTNNQNVTFSPRGADTYSAVVLDGANEGRAFDTQGDDSEITMIGELDLGVTYQLSSNSRLRVGYRALFVSDVAMAVSQTERSFSDFNAVQSPTDNDDLILQGGYFGAEFAF